MTEIKRLCAFLIPRQAVDHLPGTHLMLSLNLHSQDVSNWVDSVSKVMFLP